MLFTLNRLRTRYHHLAQSEDVQRRTRGALQTFQDVLLRIRLSSPKIKGGLIGACLFILLLLSWSFTSSSPTKSVHLNSSLQSTTHQTRYLHLVVTSPYKTLPSCRLLVSAASNNYPTALLTSWNPNVYNTSNPLTPLQKIQGIVNFLTSLDERHNNDVVILPSSTSTIFQLRPDVLLERYLELTRITQERIEQDLGKSVVEKESIHQRVIFAAQKTCAGKVDDAACYAIPETPLSPRIYGQLTDRSEGYTRERYLSNGFMMGDLDAVRRLYKSVLKAMKVEGGSGTEEEILSKIFGEQEYNREGLKRTYATPSKWRMFLNVLGIAGENRVMDLHPEHKKIDVSGGTGAVDYGIALDYEGMLGSARMSEKIMGVVVFNSSTAVEKLRGFVGVANGRQISLSEDVEKRSLKPWWSRNPTLDGFPSKLGWKDVNLLTNLWSGNVPATINIPDAEGEAGQKVAKETWDSLWFRPFVRKKMDHFVDQPDRAFVRTRGAGVETAWWGLKRDKFKLKHAVGGDWVEWREICEGFGAEVFADGGEDGFKSKIVDWGVLDTDRW